MVYMTGICADCREQTTCPCAEEARDTLCKDKITLEQSDSSRVIQSETSPLALEEFNEGLEGFPEVHI